MKSLKVEKLEMFSAPISYPPSPAELLIISALIKNKIPFMREVSFKDFRTGKGEYYRYDFVLLKNKIIIEYDGKRWHSTKESRKNDRIKTRFCKDNGLTLIRLNKSSWHILESVILQCSSLEPKCPDENDKH